ncbi:MAG TPA: substrate-binding domain-containing protein, partial [Candidatus Binatia bacterium]|nr:substrate-binding domain-containing protein [Candidatus Binatia bacterium]
ANGGAPRAEVYHELFYRNQVAGFLLADTVQDDPRVAMLIDEGIPFATFGRANAEWDFHWVDVDGRYGLRIVVEHLLGDGHRRVGFITWPTGSQSGAYREQGYRQALERYGIDPREEWIVRGKHSAELGRRGVRTLLQLPAERRPTAIACVSDLVAIGALDGAAKAGVQVGEDLAITGFDDVSLGQYLQPPLTSVRQPIAEVGERVVDLLLRQIRGEEIAQKGVLLKPELIVRASG